MQIKNIILCLILTIITPLFIQSSETQLISKDSLHLEYMKSLIKKIDATLAEPKVETREKALRELHNELTGSIAIIESEITAAGGHIIDNADIDDETKIMYYILKGLENKVGQAKRSIEFE